MKILVVDNDKLILEFMSDILSKEGHQVLTAGDGLSALDVLRTHTPDVIFTDLVMPNIDGKRLCKIIRSVPELGDVYLAVLTSVAAEAEVDLAGLKADTCIAKGPFKEMAQNVLAVLDQPKLSSSRYLSGKVIGIEKVHPRRISIELLSLVKHLENILVSLPEGIIEIGPEQKIIYANPTAISLTGVTEEMLIGSPFLDLFSEDDQERLISTLKPKGGVPTRISEDALLILNDYLVTVDILTLKEDLSSIVIVISDVTERNRTEKELEKHREHLEELVDERIAEIKRINEQLKNEINKRRQTEKQLLQKEKLESVLEMATAVCHEMNQPLQVISGYSSLLLKEMAEDDPHYEGISEIAKQIERMAAITTNLQNITTYKTRTYINDRKMIDLDESSK
ncbi:MAG: response regulator [Thermodesulfobacteriota bacterium]|nr:response regulator [Thermodesulfobacteriota bacterium]